jgi:neutral amino acid transport system permease protein
VRPRLPSDGIGNEGLTVEHRRAKPTRRLAIALAVLGIVTSAVFAGSAAAADEPGQQAAAPAAPAAMAATAQTADGGSGPIQAATACATDATTGCVQGTLRDDNSNGVKGVSVSLTDAAGDSDKATTDADGRWAFKVSAAGQYTVTLDAGSLPKGVKATTTQVTVTAVLGQLRPAVFTLSGHPAGSKDTTQTTRSGARLVWDQFSQGLLLGLLLALASIGLSLIYGTTGLSNFAHAEQVTLGGMMAYTFGIVLGLDIFLATLIAVAIGGLSGYVQDKLIWAPLRRRGLGLTQLMVVTIGLSLALDYVFQFFYGTAVKPVSTEVQHITGPLDLTPTSYWSMLISVVVLIAIGLVLTRTRIGRATRAVSDNRALAAASGIDVDRIIRLVWIVSTALASLSGVLYALVNGGIQWSTGVQLLLLMFSAVTLGGIGTAFGALVGSLVIGVVVQMSSLVLSSELKYATALIILILILVFRPQGILGRRERVG